MLLFPLVTRPKAKKEKKAVKFGDVIADSTKVIVFDKNEPTNKKVKRRQDPGHFLHQVSNPNYQQPAKRQKIESPLKIKPQTEVFQGFSIFDDDVFGEDKVVLDTGKI